MQKYKERESPELDPGRLLEILFSFGSSRILSTGIDLDLFTVIDKGYLTVEDISRETGSSQRGIRMLLNALTAMGFLSKKGKLYNLTDISKHFLVKDSPAYMGMPEHRKRLMENWAKLTEVVKKGKPILYIERPEKSPGFFKDLVKGLFPINYTISMEATEHLGIGSKWKGLKIIDIAAGSGAWSIAMAQKDTEARVTAVDFPEVLEITKEIVNKHDLSERYEYLPGNIRDLTFGSDIYHMAILGHICHSEGEMHSKRLFAKVYKALKEGGKVLIADMIPDDNRESAIFPLMFAINMLIHTEEGDTFTFSEYKQWLTDAGFKNVKTIQVKAPSPLIIAAK